MPSEQQRPDLDDPIVADFVRDGSVAPGTTLGPDELETLYDHPAPARGWLRTNFVASLDGSAVGDDGRSGTINTPSDRQVFAALRAHADVVLVGAATVRTEGYRAITLEPWQVDLRRRLGLASYPRLAVITSSLDLDPELADAGAPAGPVTVLTTEGQDPDALARFRDHGVDVTEFPGEHVGVTEAVAHLVGTAGPRLLCEGGAGLHRRLIDAGLVDDLCLTIASRLVGGDGGRIVTGGPLQPNPVAELAHLLHADDGSLFTRYLIPR
ncbi:riboflavin biosynthesis pyrimidine reductase [Friedmanniella endophytica]|uniref:Riboflavin biosynthesis pyrimidine reductase n=1 Tax=Microlunatus kandeliicorticis TaxID=1759536 RepID=A0A7W3P6G7_9ACTN|nr:dihydrofolate reductase family protein [Microlunatus kandeliicorticis]MBA8794895.1 riboflavin biosynthesis pyrimidine reductase [Microlunatus kandeliicorticis]